VSRNASISARITGDNSDFKKTLADADQSARNWSTRMGAMRQNVVRDFGAAPAGGTPGGFLGSAFSGAALARMAGGLAAVGAAVAIVHKGLNFGDAYVDMQDGLKGVGESAETVQEQLAALMDLASNPGVSFPQAVEGSKNLRAIGYSAAESRAIVLALGNALAATGEDDALLSGVIESLTKISDRGEISERQFIALSQTAPKIRDAFKAMGIETAQDIGKLGTDTKQIIAALVTELQKLQLEPPDFADKKRIFAENAKFRAMQASAAAGEFVGNQSDGFDQQTTATRAARTAKITAPPVDQAEVERRRLALLRGAEQERSLRVSIKAAEMEGLFASDLRLQLDILTQTDAVMKQLGITRAEAVRYLTQGLELEEAQFNVARRKAAADKAAAESERAAQKAAGQGAAGERERADQKAGGRGAAAERERGVAPVIDRNDPDVRNERKFNQSVDLKRKFGTYEGYLNRNEETPGSLAREQSFSGLDAFKNMQKDPNFGVVKTRRELELKARSERLEKEGKGESEEAKLLKNAVKVLDEIAANTAGQSKGKSEPLRRE